MSADISSADSSAMSAISASPASWIVAIVVSCLLAWGIYNFPPKTWRIPDDMTNISPQSPAADQARLAAVIEANKWKNTLIKFGLAGLAMGLCGLLFSLPQIGKRIGTAVAMALIGLASGLIGGVLGLIVRRYLDLEYPIPGISDSMRPLFVDSVVLALVSIFLLIPLTALLRSQPDAATRSKAPAAPLAGLLTGLLVPFSAALILSATTNSSLYPPQGMDFTAVWFAALAVLSVLLIMLMGQKEPRPAKQ